MRKLLLTLGTGFLSVSFLSAQNIAINTSGSAADPSAMLDVSSTNTGLLAPRMTTAQRTAIATPAAGLLVYDTSFQAFWYFDGTVWRPLLNNNTGWTVLGNPTTVAGTNFAGTTDNVSFDIRTNNTQRARVMNTGEMAVNTATPFAGDVFSSYGAGTNAAVNGYLTGNGAGNAGWFQSVNANIASGTLDAYTTGAGYCIVAQVNNSANTRAAVSATTNNLLSTAVVGSVNATGTFTSLTTGSGGAFSHPTLGVLGYAPNAGSTGGFFNGQGAALATLVGGSGIAVNGTTAGVYATASTVATSTAGIFASNGAASNTLAGTGSGISARGTAMGVFGSSVNAGNNSWGGYFASGNANGYAYVGGRVGGTDYKINGPGTVATMVPDMNGQNVNMFCPEAPEILFQDFGSGTLVNGKAHIVLDPVYAKNITVNDAHPLRVIIQLEGDCKGVFVTNKTGDGFDVQELDGGTSNVSFTWFVSANRADRLNADGSVDSRHADVRFPSSPVKPVTVEGERNESNIIVEEKKKAPVKTTVQ